MPSEEETYDTTKCLKEYRIHRNPAVFAELIRRNMGLVRKVAAGYRHYIDHQLDFEDLVSEGVFGLIEAIEKFDEARGVHFSTYAYWWIQQRIARAIINTGTTVRIPVHMVETVLKVKQAEHRYISKHGKVNATAICRQLDIPLAVYKQAKRVEQQFFNMTSLDHRPSDREDRDAEAFVSGETHFVAGGFSSHFADPALLADRRDRQRQLYRAIARCLNPRERNVVIGRFGLCGDRPKTLEEIGDTYGVTPSRIRQIEKNALKKLRKALSCTENGYDKMCI